MTTRRRPHKPIILAMILVASLVMTGGCKGSKPSPSPKRPAVAPQQSAPAQAGQSSAIPETKAEKEVYVYDAKGRRDPFTSLAVVMKTKLARKKGAAAIENFDVDEMKLIAIAWDSKSSFAQVVTPDGKSYTLRKGMTVGLYGGKVMNITPDTVVIQEQVKDYRGQQKTKDTILKLRKEGEE